MNRSSFLKKEFKERKKKKKKKKTNFLFFIKKSLAEAIVGILTILRDVASPFEFLTLFFIFVTI